MRETKWDLVAKRYDEIMGSEGGPHHKNTLTPTLLGFLGDVRGKRILDLACGQGYLSRCLAGSGAEVTGIDLSAELLKIAQKYEGRVNYLQRDAADLRGIRNEHFDAVVCNMAMHDIEDLESALSECSRVLKKGGLLVFSILHPIADGLKSGEAEKDRTGPFVRLRHYNKDRKLPHRAYGIYGISLYHRPLDHYFNGLFANGFTVHGFREISARGDPTYAGASIFKRAFLFARGKLGMKEPVKDPPRWILELWEEIPLFVVVAARKE